MSASRKSRRRQSRHEHQNLPQDQIEEAVRVALAKTHFAELKGHLNVLMAKSRVLPTELMQAAALVSLIVRS